MSRNERLPFHFNDSDLELRRAEFLKRFGLSSDDDRNVFHETPSLTSFGSNWPDWQERFRRAGHFDEADWRNRAWYSQTGSEPGSPRIQHRMRTPLWSSCDADSIPIRVMRENSPVKCGADDASESETSSQGSHSSSGHSGHSQHKGKEPRVHHIPIMVEPRDGSVSSGYASDGATDDSKMEHNLHKHSAGVSLCSGANGPLLGTNVKQRQVDNHGRDYSLHNLSSENNCYNARECEALSHKHQVPIQVHSPQQNASGNRMGPDSESPRNKFAEQKSPVRSFSDNSVVQGSPNGKTMSKQRSKSSTPEPAQFKKQTNGPHVTKIPVNVSSVFDMESRNETPSLQSSQQSTFGALAKISAVQKEVESLRREVEAFSANANDKYFRFLDEMLTRSMLKLDNINTEGKDDVRAARKTVVKEIESCIAMLESKLRQGTNTSNSETGSLIEVGMRESSGEHTEEDSIAETEGNGIIAHEVTDTNAISSELQPTERNCVEEGAKVNDIAQTNEPCSSVELLENEVAGTEYMEIELGGNASKEMEQLEIRQSSDVETTKL